MAQQQDPPALVVFIATEERLNFYLNRLSSSNPPQWQFQFVILRTIPAEAYTRFQNQMVLNIITRGRYDFIFNPRLNGQLPIVPIYSLQQFFNQLGRGFIAGIPQATPPLLEIQIRTAAFANRVEWERI